MLLGDEFVEPDEPLLPAMLDLQARTGGIVLAFIEVDPTETSRYGIASVEPAELGLTDRRGRQGDRPGGEAAAGGGAEQPRGARPLRPAGARSSTRSGGTKPGSGGEIQLTDAMASCCAPRARRCTASSTAGTRYDTGMPLGYLQTVVQIAAKRDDLGAEFRRWLADFVGRAVADGDDRRRPTPRRPPTS